MDLTRIIGLRQMPDGANAAEATITKDQIAPLGSHKGEVDLDCGKVYLCFCGALDQADGLYHGQLWWDGNASTEGLPTFSMKSVIDAPSAPTLFAEEPIGPALAEEE